MFQGSCSECVWGLCAGAKGSCFWVRGALPVREGAASKHRSGREGAGDFATAANSRAEQRLQERHERRLALLREQPASGL